MDLVRLVYHSRRRHDPVRSLTDQLGDIIIDSVANNRRDDITGALLYDDKWFVQILEGGNGNVSATFERILVDSRHAGVVLVNMQPIPMRRFGAWWMAEARYNPAAEDLFRHYGESGSFDPSLVRHDHLIEMVERAIGARAPQNAALPVAPSNAA